MKKPLRGNAHARVKVVFERTYEIEYLLRIRMIFQHQSILWKKSTFFTSLKTLLLLSTLKLGQLFVRFNPWNAIFLCVIGNMD